MANSRRKFLKHAAGASLLPTFGFASNSITKKLPPAPLNKTAEELAADEEYWDKIRFLYYQNPNFINLESGYFSPSVEFVKDEWIENINEINASPSFYMRRKQMEDRDNLRDAMAKFIGVEKDEIIFTRNTTESLNIVIHGLKLNDGDEILRTNREYPSMIEALDQRSNRFGTPVKVVDVPLHPKSKQEIVDTIEQAITPATKILLVSHIIYLNGQVLPVKEITAMAKSRDLQVIVDGAHAFTHIDQDIADIGCDYYACSLHKWFGAPLGNGLLYVKKGNAKNLWPLFGDTKIEEDNIEKLAHFGTMPCSNQIAMEASLAFNEKLTKARKQARLQYLKTRWTSQLKDVKGIKFYTPLANEFSGAIANVGVEGMKPQQLADRLYSDYKIFTVAIDHEDIQGVRIAPNFHNTMEDLDYLANALKEIAASA